MHGQSCSILLAVSEGIFIAGAQGLASHDACLGVMAGLAWCVYL